MADATSWALAGTAALTALLHTLIPDHWLPFVLIGRAQRWTVGTVAAVSGLSALVHTALSLGLGLAAVAIGWGAAEVVGQRLERAGALLLVAFGLGYALWAWRKGGHFHPGGARVHPGHVTRGCSGEEGPANPEHLHYHADEDLIRGHAGRGGLALALIVGLNPCVLVLPVVLAGSGRGPALATVVALCYGIPTVALTVGLSVMGVLGRSTIRLPGAARVAEPLSGILIALLGTVFWVLGS